MAQSDETCDRCGHINYVVPGATSTRDERCADHIQRCDAREPANTTLTELCVCCGTRVLKTYKREHEKRCELCKVCNYGVHAMDGIISQSSSDMGDSDSSDESCDGGSDDYEMEKIAQKKKSCSASTLR